MGLYESLGLAVVHMTRKENPDILEIGGPIWLLQLWLNATFKPSLKTRVPPNPLVGVEELMLSKLTPDDGKVVSRPLKIISKCCTGSKLLLQLYHLLLVHNAVLIGLGNLASILPGKKRIR